MLVFGIRTGCRILGKILHEVITESEAAISIVVKNCTAWEVRSFVQYSFSDQIVDLCEYTMSKAS